MEAARPPGGASVVPEDPSQGRSGKKGRPGRGVRLPDKIQKAPVKLEFHINRFFLTNKNGIKNNSFI